MNTDGISTEVTSYHPRSLEAALSAMPVGISWANLADQKIVFVNRKFTEIFGYELIDLTDIANWIDAYPYTDDQETARKEWGAYFAVPDRFEFPIDPMELRIRCKDGSIKTIIHSGVILPETGWALATFVDITDRKRDEILLKAAERQARENQAIYRLLLDHSPGMIVLVPFDRSRRFVSSAVEQITGFTAEEYLALEGMDMIHPEDRSAAADLIKALKEDGEPSIFRYRALRKGGGHCWVEASVTGYVDPVSRQITGYVATVRDVSEQKEREEFLASEYRHLSDVAALDDLTGIANRRTFNKIFEKESLRQTRTNHNLSLLLLDVDYFKRYNDLNGHVAGDACLRQIAATIKSSIRRDADLAARYGGEEFVVLMPLTPIVGAAIIARKIIDAVRALAIPHLDSPHGVVTVSIGIACWKSGARISPSDLVEQADRALYRAKDNGRNTYEAFDADSSSGQS